MKEFKKNVFTFIFVLFFTSILLIVNIFFVYKQKLHSVVFDKNITIVICGDSHPMSAINDSILEGSINISDHSQKYFYTFNVLKLVLKNNPQIKTVILGSSFHSFSGNDKNIFDSENATKFFPIFFPILDYESATVIISNSFLPMVKSSKDIIKSMIIETIRNFNSYQSYPFIGNYYKSYNNNLNDSTVIKAIKRHFYQQNGMEQGFSNYQNKYLKKIVELCIKHNVKVIIINTPVSDNYFKKIPEKFISNYYSTISNFISSVDFWDFHSLHLENRCFGDGDHLNALGAKALTMKIDSILENKVHGGKKGIN
jgi:hypothetical protein